MKSIKSIVIILLGLLFASCYKDLGNYDYKRINEVKFAGFPTEKQFAFRYADSLKVYPDISGTVDKDDLSHYSFKWEAVVKQGSVDGRTNFPLDSNTVNLEYFVRLPEAEYSVYLYVKDKTTDVTWRQAFDLKVTTSLYEGWLILSDRKGYSRLDMVSLSGQDELIVRDIWGYSPLSRWKGPRRLAHWADMFAGSDHPVYLLTDDGAMKLDPQDYGYDEVNDMKYEFGKMEEGYTPLCLRGGYADCTVVCLGKEAVYVKNTQMPGAIFGVPVNKLTGENQYYGVAPVIGKTGYAYSYNPPILFYDTTNSRFVQMNSGLNGTTMPVAKETYFPFKTGKKFVYMTGTLHDTYGYIFALLKDNAEKCWLYGLRSTNYASNIEQAKDYYYQIDAPDIERAHCFAIHPILYYLFYAVGNQIHQFDMVTKEHRILPITFKDGTRNALPEGKISMLKFNIFVLDTYSKPTGSAQMQYRLIVGSEKEGEELGGVVRMLEIPTGTDKPASVYREYDGFGKVIDVVYRERM